MEEIVSLIIPFISLTILSVMIDKIVVTLEEILHKLPYLPDFIEPIAAYIIALIIALFLCDLSSFDIFIYLGMEFPYNVGQYLTAIMISQGSHYMRSNFAAINDIPSVFSGLTATIKSLFK